MFGAGHQPYRKDGSDRGYPRKGKQKRDGLSGKGGSEGIILSLEYVGTGPYDASYTLPMRLGSQKQNLSVQIDTGSSDLWVASKSCEDTVCSYPGSDKLYDPSSAINTQTPFQIQYLSGQVSGEVYWDQVEVGGYTIGSQALAAATSVTDEPLGPSFSGVLGLALPGNSIIASKIPAGFSNAPDGAAWASNLFSITPGPDNPDEVAPSQKFLGLTLSRPGSDKIPSLLAIGQHPPPGMLTLPDSLGGSSAQIGYDKVNYHSPLPSYDRDGDEIDPLYWKVQITGISVWVDGQEKPINLLPTPGVPRGTGISAVLDSGVPVIVTSKAIADGIYGALGIGPADDGNYYIPCTTPLNLTFNILTTSTSSTSQTSTVTAVTTSASTTSAAHTKRSPSTPITVSYSVHPLDLSDASTSSKSCTSLILANDVGLANTGVADMILGVPFLRGVYFVMAYQQPKADGSFPVLAAVGDAVPLLGLQTILDPANSLEEFNRVRVLNQPIDDPNAKCVNASCTNTTDKKLSTGIYVLIVVAVVVGVLLILGAILYLRNRRRRREEDRGVFAPVSTQEAEKVLVNEGKSSAGFATLIPAWMKKSEKSQYQPTPLHERNGSAGNDGVSEEDLRRIRYARYLARNDGGPLPPPPLLLNSTKDDDYSTTMSSGKTRVGESPSRNKGRDSEEKEHRIEEFLNDKPQDLFTTPPTTSPPLPTPLQPVHSPMRPDDALPDSASTLPRSPHQRNFSESSVVPSSSLRGRTEIPARNVVSTYGEFGELPSGMAGIGTASRSKKGIGGGLNFTATEKTGTSDEDSGPGSRGRAPLGPRRPSK